MKTETVIGALIAATISFLTALLALFNNDAELTLETISQSAWISMGVGALIQFLKDYQALSTRRVVSKVLGKEK